MSNQRHFLPHYKRKVVEYRRTGSPDWTRTSNPSVNSRMLCQLSYRGICVDRITPAKQNVVFLNLERCHFALRSLHKQPVLLPKQYTFLSTFFQRHRSYFSWVLLFYLATASGSFQQAVEREGTLQFRNQVYPIVTHVSLQPVRALFRTPEVLSHAPHTPHSPGSPRSFRLS